MKDLPTQRRATSLALPMIATLALAAACATATPVELNNARIAYARASGGPAAQQVPADLHKAKTALDQAEQSFAADADMQQTVDLAYIAERTAQIAEAHAQTALAESKTAKATAEFGAKQGEIVKNAQGALVRTREQLSEAERGQAVLAEKAAAERLAREEADRKAAASDQNAALAEQKAKEANDALAKLAAKEEARGLVITLSGSVLFRSNDAQLLPAAFTRLDEVAGALVAKGQDVVVEGYTDSRGSMTTNMDLSRRRAESVRTYLVSHGVRSDTIQARGMGPERPVAENTSAEGRANNRRVEIVIGNASGRTTAR